MGIQILPGPDAVLNPAIAGLGQAIDKFLNPNRDLQRSVQAAMATNPELLQHMADLESGNPGTFAKLGLGPVADLISSVGPSTHEIVDTALQPGAAATAIAKQGAEKATAQAQTAQAGLTGDIVKKAGNIMAQDPSISFDTALRTLTGQTGTGRTAEQMKNQVEIGSGQKTLEALQRAGQLPKDLSQVDWTGKATDFLNGHLSGSEASAYFGNPDTSKAFTEAIDGVKQQRQLDAQKAIAALHGDKSVDNFRTQKAFQEYEKSGGVGTLDTWHKFLFDPEAQDRARNLMNGSVQPANQEDRDLKSIAQVTKQQVATDKLRDITTLNNNINTAMKRVDTAGSDQEREVAIQGLNQLLSQRSQFGGMKVQASYNDRGFWLPGRVEYKTPDGKMVDEAVVNAVIADPVATDIIGNTAISDRARTALSLIQNFSGDKMAALNKFKMQDRSANKEDSRAVEQELARLGVIKIVGR
jgi:hypothetical protein